MRQYLITSDEVSSLARGMSIHIEQEKIETYIRESEDIDLKPSLGDALFIDLQEHSEKYELLMNGGVYEDEESEILSTLPSFAPAAPAKVSAFVLESFTASMRAALRASSISEEESVMEERVMPSSSASLP